MKQNIIKYGTIAGAALIVYLLLYYFWDRETLLGASVRLSTYLIYFWGMYWGAMQIAQEEFKNVLRTAFGIFIVINLNYYVFDYVMFNYLDPTLVSAEKKIMIDYYTSHAKTIEDTQAYRQSIQDGNFHTLKALAFAFSKGAIGGFGLSILISYLVKRRY